LARPCDDKLLNFSRLAEMRAPDDLIHSSPNSIGGAKQ
jgi:hypothetical protein